MKFITEKDIADWVLANEGILWTRDIMNIHQQNLSLCEPNTLVYMKNFYIYIIEGSDRG